MPKTKIEYHDSCPKCKSRMVETDKKDRKVLIYYCKKCRQKYRIETAHKSEVIECPHCKKKIRIDAKSISNMHFNTVWTFYTRKVKIDGRRGKTKKKAE